MHKQTFPRVYAIGNVTPLSECLYCATVAFTEIIQFYFRLGYSSAESIRLITKAFERNSEKKNAGASGIAWDSLNVLHIVEGFQAKLRKC